MWSLDFFRHLIPPFCVDRRITNIHVIILKLILAFYPLVLILLTYILIELHARNFYLIVKLWRPFNRCVAKVRRSYDPKASIFNAFSTFFLLSFSKMTFIGSCFLPRVRISGFKNGSIDNCLSVFYYDPNRQRINNVHAYLIPYIITLAIFIFPPDTAPSVLSHQSFS